MKKTLALGMAAAMTATLLAGCSGSSSSAASSAAASTAESTASSTAAASTAESTGSYTDYSAGFPENVTIQIPVYDRGFENWNPTDNYYTRWIQSEFGDKYNVTVKYVAIARSNEVQDFNQMIAAGNAPTIIFIMICLLLSTTGPKVLSSPSIWMKLPTMPLPIGIT